MLKSIVTIIVTCALAFSNPTFAEEGTTLTMDSAIRDALESNPEIVAAIREFEAKRSRAPQAATPPDPKFMLGFTEVPVTTLDTAQGMREYIVEQEIPFPPKLIFGHKAEIREAEAALTRHIATAQEIRRQVKHAYLDLFKIAEEAKIHREALSLYRTSKGSSEEAYATLKGTAADPVRASVELGGIEARLAALEGERLEAIATISRLVAHPIDPSLTPLPPPPLPPIGKLDDLTQKAKTAKPEIEEQDKMIASLNARVALAKAQLGPDISLSGGFIQMPGNQQNAWTARAGISVPLWSFSKQRFAVRESKAWLARAHSMKETEILTAEQDVKMAYSRLVAAKRVIEIYDKAVIPRARLLLSSSREAYRSDKGDFLNVVDSIRGLVDARIALVVAKTDAAKAYADLERAVGAPIEMEEKR